MRKAYLFIAAVGFLLSHPWPLLRMDFLPTGSTWSPKRKPNSPTGSLHSVR